MNCQNEVCSHQVSNEFPKEDINVFAVFKNERAALKLYAIKAYHPSYYFFGSIGFSVGIDKQIVVVSGKEDNYYVAIDNYTISDNTIYTSEPKQIGETALLDLLILCNL